MRLETESIGLDLDTRLASSSSSRAHESRTHYVTSCDVIFHFNRKLINVTGKTKWRHIIIMVMAVQLDNTGYFVVFLGSRL